MDLSQPSGFDIWTDRLYKAEALNSNTEQTSSSTRTATFEIEAQETPETLTVVSLYNLVGVNICWSLVAQPR